MILTQSPRPGGERGRSAAAFLPMPTIERRPLENAADDRDRWARIAALITAWAQSGGVALRDAIVLLPFAQLLPHARQAFARAGGWLPRIETTRTLAASLGPAPRC
jgi:ATP-dependent helicase/nuclease subunit B